MFFFSYKFIRLIAIFSLFFLFCHILYGGYTRLSDSGLSIVEWKPIEGFLYPNAQGLEKDFKLYKGTHEFQTYNFYMDIHSFKKIYFPEWLHRFFGRFFSITMLILSVFMCISCYIYRYPREKFFSPLKIFFLCIIQGILGLFMVRSGYNDIDVKPYMLMIHLFVALWIYSYLLVYIFSLSRNSIFFTPPPFLKVIRKKKFVAWILLLLFVQILLGSIIAGSRTGWLNSLTPFVDLYGILNGSTLQIDTLIVYLHRLLAIIITIFALIDLALSYSSKFEKKCSIIFLSLLIVQITCGIFVVNFGWKEIYICMLHQAISLFLLTAILYRLYYIGSFRGLYFL